jgi:hypothetical protein
MVKIALAEKCLGGKDYLEKIPFSHMSKTMASKVHTPFPPPPPLQVDIGKASTFKIERKKTTRSKRKVANGVVWRKEVGMEGSSSFDSKIKHMAIGHFKVLLCHDAYCHV